MAEWKKVVVSGSNITQLNNDANYLINGQSGATLTGSFSGSFVGTTDLPDLTNGEGVAPFTYDGLATATVAVSGAADLTNNTITKWNDTDGKFTNSNITDNGTLVDINSSTTISGSLNVTGSQVILNTNELYVYTPNGSEVVSIDGNSGILFRDLNQSASIDVENRELYDSTPSGPLVASLNWNTRQLIKSDGTTVTVDWENGLFSGSFSGSFQGNGSGLTNIPASGITGLNLSMIATGSVTASVNVGTNAFTIVSGSATLHNIRANGGFEHGFAVTASGAWSHAEGSQTTASGTYSHAEGDSTIASGGSSHAEGENTLASGYSSHAEGQGTTASGYYSHAEGKTTTASGYGSHSEGKLTTASGPYSHAEGGTTTSSGDYSHAEGTNTTASGYGSHAEGFGTNSIGNYSHAEGGTTTSSGDYSHAEGASTTASGNYSHAEGNGTTSYGQHSHAEGVGTIASGSGQLAVGQYNTHNNTTSLVVIGNGTDDANRSDLALFNSQSITFNQPVTGSIFTGSFVGDGSGLTGVTAVTANALSQGTGITAFSFNGSTAQTVAVSGSAGLSANTLTKWTGDAFANTNIADNGTLVTVNADTTFNQDVAITGDLTVQGTASFQNTQNLLVADRFVLFASGSNTTGDGGIVVQQGTQGVGELFGYDSTATRWGFTSSFDAATSTFSPAVYVGAVQTGTGQTAASAAPIYGGAAAGFGTIHVDTDDGEIWIYA